MIVKIISSQKPSYWYNDMIGQKIKIKNDPPVKADGYNMWYRVDNYIKESSQAYIRVCDCELVSRKDKLKRILYEKVSNKNT